MSRLRLFVSAGPDLEADREAVGRVAAQLPVTIGWVIKGTPGRGRTSPELQRFVEQCDFFIFLLGSDIAAPMGVEWAAARRTGRICMNFLRGGSRTPSARAFAFSFQGEWNRYQDVRDLEGTLRHMLSRSLLDRAEELHLTLAEWENLSRYAEGLNREEEAFGVEVNPEEGGRTGSGGIIISPDRDVPAGGVIISGQGGGSG